MAPRRIRAVIQFLGTGGGAIRAGDVLRGIHRQRVRVTERTATLLLPNSHRIQIRKEGSRNGRGELFYGAVVALFEDEEVYFSDELAPYDGMHLVVAFKDGEELWIQTRADGARPSDVEGA